MLTILIFGQYVIINGRWYEVLAWSPHLVTDSTVFDYLNRRDEQGVVS